MSIAIRETLGQEGFTIDWNYVEPKEPINVQESVGAISPDSLMVDIEGIHVGPTRNHTWYTEEGLKYSIPTWTKPYNKPLIMHHNEKDGRIIGRIKYVNYTDKNTKSGTGALVFTTNVPDKEGKEQIKDGRLHTVSIGAIVHEAECSICGANMASMSREELEEHEHVRGETYKVDGVEKTCYWVIKKMEAKELSYVIVPSDVYAQNIRVYKPDQGELKESFSKGELNLAEATQNTDPIVVKENNEINENGQQTDPAILQELEDLRAKNREFETKCKDLEAQVADLTEQKTKATKEIEDAKVMLEQVQKQLSEVKGTLATKESDLGREIKLREDLEGQLISANKQIKEGLIDNLSILRTSLNKPLVAKEELDKRSEESIKDAIRDLKEELSNPNDVTQITNVTNPTIIESEEDSKRNVKEKKNVSNIDLQESAYNLLSNLMTAPKLPL